MNIIEQQQPTESDPYSLRYDQLRQSIIDAATTGEDDLDGAAIELTEGYFLAFDAPDDGYPSVWSSFGALDYLNSTGKLTEDAELCSVSKMRRHDVFFGLALYENEAAHYLLSNLASVSEQGWTRREAHACGMLAAVSATQCQAFGTALKQQWLVRYPKRITTSNVHDNVADQYRIFAPSRTSSCPLWRRPRVLWQSAICSTLSISTYPTFIASDEYLP